ncbi:hypothetical protein ACFL18_02155 [Patescibacteria group bacterium]
MNFKEILKLEGNIKILVNRRNWVLQQGSDNNRWYYPTLDYLCDDLLEIRLKTQVIKARKVKSDIRELIKAVRDTRGLVRKDLEAIQSIVKKPEVASIKRD